MYDYIQLGHELLKIEEDIKKLRSRKKQIHRIFKSNNTVPINNKEFYFKNIWLYVLELENGKYYVGMTRDVDGRFKRHKKGKGAQWTKMYKPISIIKSYDTGIIDESEASILEDNLTLETAENYGHDNVRGGQWCLIKNTYRLEDNWIKII